MVSLRRRLFVLSEVRPGRARQGKAGQGGAGLGWVGRGLARLGRARPGGARRGTVWLGQARRGCQWHILFSVSTSKAERLTMNKFCEKDPEIEEQLCLIEQISSVLHRGSVLFTAEVERMLGLSQETNRFKYLIKKWRRNMHRDRKIETWPVIGQGYKLLTHVEQVTLIPDRRAKRSYRQHGMILRSLSNTDMSKLSVRARQMALAVKQHSIAARSEARRVRKYSAKGNAQTDRRILIERLPGQKAG